MESLAARVEMLVGENEELRQDQMARLDSATGPVSRGTHTIEIRETAFTFSKTSASSQIAVQSFRNVQPTHSKDPSPRLQTLQPAFRKRAQPACPKRARMPHAPFSLSFVLLSRTVVWVAVWSGATRWWS